MANCPARNSTPSPRPVCLVRAVAIGLALVACQPIRDDNSRGTDATIEQTGAADETATDVPRLCDGVRAGAPGARHVLLTEPFSGKGDPDSGHIFQLRHSVYASARLLAPAPNADTATVWLAVRDGAAVTLEALEAEFGAWRALPVPPINSDTGAPAVGGRVAFSSVTSNHGQTLCTIRAEVADRIPVATSAVTAVMVDGGRLD